MTFRQFLLKSILSNIRNLNLYFLSTILSMTFFFLFATLWFNEGFQQNTNGPMRTLMIIAGTTTLIYAVFIISYVHTHLMKRRSKSFSVLLSYGMRYRDLQKMVIFESALIYVLSLLSAFVTGSVFSRLFFLISVKLLDIEQIEYHLSVESFLATVVVFVPVFLIITASGCKKVVHTSIMDLATYDQKPEFHGSSSGALGVLGIVLIIGSILWMNFYIQNAIENKGIVILTVAFMCLVGVYLTIRKLSHLLYTRNLKRPNRYYGRILEASEFVMSYRQNHKTFFVIGILTFGIILHTAITYTLYTESYRMVEKESLFDIQIQEIAAFDVVDENIIREWAAKEPLVETTAALDFVYVEAKNLKINSWRTCQWIPVVEAEAINSILGTDFDIKSGEAGQLIFESDVTGKIQYFDDYAQVRHPGGSWELKTQSPVYLKAFDRYAFPQSMMLILNRQDFQRIQESASDMERGREYMFTFRDWKESKDFTNLVYSSMNDSRDEVGAKDNEIFNAIMERYDFTPFNMRAKFFTYEYTKMQGSFSLFIMGFVSLLFWIANYVTFYFKVYMDFDKDLLRFRKLLGIGILEREINRLVFSRIRMMVVLPTVIGASVGALWCLALNFNKLIELEVKGETFAVNTLVTTLIYVGLTLGYGVILNGMYRKKLQDSMEDGQWGSF